MQPPDAIARRLKAVRQDRRLSYPTATIATNAPLALIQLAVDTEIRVLTWVLSTPKGDPPCPKKK